MLTQILLMVVDALCGFFTVLLLSRFYMQWARVGFRNSMGLFVIQATDWLVIPLRRVLPGFAGLDLASLVPAMLLQSVQSALVLWLRGAPLDPSPVLGLVLLALGVLEVIKLSVYLLIAVVILSALLSWVNPNAPMRGVLEVFAKPFLQPFQRRLPTIANVDMSPLVLLLVLQVLLTLVAHARSTVLMYLL